MSTYQDLTGREIVVGGESKRDPVNGSDLQLTIDADIQHSAEQALAAGVAGNKAESGSVLVMDPKTGAIIAWADYPTYNANSFGQTPVDRFIDPIASHLYEPGSTMKVVTLSGALENQAITPTTTLNDPGRISHTTRDAITELLSEIPGCRIPDILRLPADKDVAAAVREAELLFSFPLLVRPAGTHGGDDFEKCADAAALAEYLSPRKGDHYLIEYIDYASADGHFRKYRFIFVGAKVMPYHLCIGNDWKVHHVSTDMANQPWMQQEEAAFLANPGAVFSQAHYQTLNTIRERIGLDYFGIDCALDGEGNLVVFEVNASMLVHARNEGFSYKDAYVRAIKDAFDAMLHERAEKGL